ncbi:MAG: FAD-dependent oxidoreductase [Kiritimatiellia bacterium]|jgi:protoporphyrinogen oxidase|nr:FAD-dependent oxidoreductase [Kiritimatiellia bacterium]
MRVGVIGAGPAGMAAAYEMTKAGAHVEVFERDAAVGGMAKSIPLWGQTVDLGPHRFFSSDTRVNRLWLELAGQDYEMVNRLTRILYKGRFYHYPLKPFNALRNLGLAEALLCMASYARERVSPHPPSATPTFEEWVVSRFGRRLFNIFFKTYSEKLWGIPCCDLDADFAAQRIKKFSLSEAVKSAFGIGAAQHKTLADQFAYPFGGTGSIYRRMADLCEARGSRLWLNTPVRRVVCQDRRAIGVELENGETRLFDRVVSCMPITDLVTRMDRVPPEVTAAAACLRFRNTVLVYLRIGAADLFRDNWLYVHSTELQTGRITNFRNWTPHILGNSPDTILAMEYWCYTEDLLWQQADDALIALAGDEIARSGLLAGNSILDGRVVRIRNAYPVYARGYREPLAVVVSHLKTLANLAVIGRYGAFKYNNQDHSLLMGLLAARNLCAEAHHDLWAINTDYEYQETSRITETGLVQIR